MSEFDLEIHKKGLEFARKVIALAAEAPDNFAESKIHKLGNVLNQRYGMTRRLKKTLIVQYVRRSGGNASVPEIIEGLGWYKAEVWELVHSLVTDGSIVFYDAELIGDIQRKTGSGRGRRARRIKIVEK